MEALMIWNIEGSNSSIGFSVKHMMFATVKGRFRQMTGKMVLDEENIANSFIEATVETTSIETDDKGRDKNLRSHEFFDVVNYPTMTFKSKQIKPISRTSYKLIGDLTIRNITREVSFNVEYSGKASNPFSGDSASFRAATIINRKEFHLGWSSMVEAGGLTVSEQVKIELHIKATKEATVKVAEEVAA
jgi:polyisoprenoid-binding protein YceI